MPYNIIGERLFTDGVVRYHPGTAAMNDTTRVRIRTALFSMSNMIILVALIHLPLNPRDLWLVIVLLAAAVCLRLLDWWIGRPK
jgi:hypothetical protein